MPWEHCVHSSAQLLEPISRLFHRKAAKRAKRKRLREPVAHSAPSARLIVRRADKVHSCSAVAFHVEFIPLPSLKAIQAANNMLVRQSTKIRSHIRGTPLQRLKCLAGAI